MRKGCIAASDVPLLRQCDRPVQYPDGCEATALYATKDEVDTVNNRRLSALTTVGEEYHAIDKGGKDYRGYIVSDDTATKRLNASSLWPMFLHVKVGALVMLVTVSSERDEYKHLMQSESEQWLLGQRIDW